MVQDEFFSRQDRIKSLELRLKCNSRIHRGKDEIRPAYIHAPASNRYPDFHAWIELLEPSRPFIEIDLVFVHWGNGIGRGIDEGKCKIQMRISPNGNLFRRHGITLAGLRPAFIIANRALVGRRTSTGRRFDSLIPTEFLGRPAEAEFGAADLQRTFGIGSPLRTVAWIAF